MTERLRLDVHVWADPNGWRPCIGIGAAPGDPPPANVERRGGIVHGLRDDAAAAAAAAALRMTIRALTPPARARARVDVELACVPGRGWTWYVHALEPESDVDPAVASRVGARRPTLASAIRDAGGMAMFAAVEWAGIGGRVVHMIGRCEGQPGIHAADAALVTCRYCRRAMREASA